MALVLLAARYTLAAVFLRSGLTKILDLAEFRLAVANYRLLPPSTVSGVALTLPFAETAVAILIAIGILTDLAAGVMAVLLVIFAAAIAINLIRGRVFDCGCAGRAAPRLITWTHVRVNAAMAVAAVAVALFPPANLAVWPGPGLFTVTTPRDDILPVILTVLIGLIVAVAVQRTAQVVNLTRSLRHGEQPVPPVTRTPEEPTAP